MNCKYNTVRRLKLLGLIPDDSVLVDITQALDLLGAVGVSINPSTQIIDGHVYYPCVALRYGEGWEETEDIWPENDSTGDYGWESYGDMILHGLDLGVEWLVASKSFTLSEEQKKKLEEIYTSILSMNTITPDQCPTVSSATSNFGDVSIDEYVMLP